MPKIVNIQLIVGGEEFLPKSGYTVSIEQSVGGHSAFRIAFPANATEGYEGVMMNNALKFVGKKASIGVDDNKMEFSGVVTGVDFQKGVGAAGTVVLSGHGPSVLLANSVQCFSYEEGTTLSQVASDTTNGHSGEFLKSVLGDGTDIALPYTVQYNESDLSFLQRLCSRYGVWLYHNGTDFCIGRKGNEQVEGTVGVDVLTFNVSTSLREQVFGIKGHDWTNDTLLEAESASHSPSSSHPYLSQLKGESDTVFAKKGNYDYNVGQHEYSAQGGLDTATKVNTLGRAAGMVTVSGSSELSALRIGDTLELKGLNFSKPTNKDPYGSYDIVKIVHRFDHSGQYRNEFEGVPQGTEHLPYSNGFATPRSGAQRGRVFDNADPDGLGRIKVQFPWQQAMGTSTPWIKMVTPYSGGGKGFYFIPEKDEEVLVGFEGDNPEKPFVLSAGFNTNAKSDYADPDNNIKAIKTRSGNEVIMNDKDGSVTIQDPSGNTVLMNGDGEITITAPNVMTLNSKEINILASEAVNIDGTNNVNVTSKEILNDGSAKVTVTSAAKVEMTAPSTQVEGTAELKLKSDGILDADGTTMTNVKGGLLNLNCG
ncbi:type IV secretion protein Rhs [Aggregatimonas sangjinii]|uniref:Type IV secretion protein Rhs n=1 Tax=Aggregatimonas sangjinii TaxID=2583587 RepID=A0A5B7SNZ7_9FLAO|nr:phage baseplate assembly protein V [Aggregatimonas sangjinii]QCW99881.1 type IV secretion protein Rhs [Aggregatimonas sangjinii]